MSKKTLCKYIKANDLESKPEKFIALIQDGKYYCKKCGRVARSDKNLCKAAPFDSK